MLLDLWAWRVNSTTPPSGGRGGGRIGKIGHGFVPTDQTMRDAMRRSKIKSEDEELMLLVSTFVRTLQ